MTSGQEILNKRLRLIRVLLARSLPRTPIAAPYKPLKTDLGLRLLCRVGVFRRIRLRLLSAIVAADDDFLTADLGLDSAIVDVPITHRAFGCTHSLSFPF